MTTIIPPTGPEADFDPLWANEGGITRKRRQANERLAQQAEDGPSLDGAPNQREAANIDQAVALAKEALAAGLDPEDVAALGNLDPSSDEYLAVVDKILMAPQVSKRFSGMVNLFDKKLAELVAARDEEPVDGDAPVDQPADATAVSPEAVDTFLQALGGADDATDQVELLAQVFGDEDAGAILTELSATEDYDEQVALLTARMDALPVDDPEPETDAEEEADPETQADLLALAEKYPAGAKALRSISGGTVEQQLAALQALIDGRPVPTIDRNNPARPLRVGYESALSADGMSDEVADALLGGAGNGSLITSRRRGS
jgi:hypothetical protein